MQPRLRAIAVAGFQRVQKVSILAKVFCGVVVLFYLLSFLPNVEENLAMIPSYIVPPRIKIWTLLTAPFFEKRIIFAVLDIIAIVGFSTVLQPLWSIKEFLIFSSVVSVVSQLTGLLFSVFLYAVTQSFDCLLVPFHGMVALACGYVVSVKQFHPDSVTFPPPAPPTLRVKHLPLLIILFSTLLACLHVLSYAFAWLALSGTLTAWVYLRFYQKKEQGGRGDMAESFAFATFFPEPIQPPIARLGGFVYFVLVSIKVCPKTVRTYDVSAPSTIKLTLPGTDPADAQRRKQRALKALDERLSKVEQPLGWPSMDDAGTSSQDELVSPPKQAPPQHEAVVIETTPAIPPDAKPVAPPTGESSAAKTNSA